MRILNREAFMQCPNGTVFFDYHPHCFENLSVKTCDPKPLRDEDDEGLNDFFRLYIDSTLNVAAPGETESCSSSDTSFDLMERALKGERLDLYFDSGGRDGMFEEDALFAVLDEGDVERLVSLLLGKDIWTFLNDAEVVRDLKAKHAEEIALHRAKEAQLLVARDDARAEVVEVTAANERVNAQLADAFDTNVSLTNGLKAVMAECDRLKAETVRLEALVTEEARLVVENKALREEVAAWRSGNPSDDLWRVRMEQAEEKVDALLMTTAGQALLSTASNAKVTVLEAAVENLERENANLEAENKMMSREATRLVLQRDAMRVAGGNLCHALRVSTPLTVDRDLQDKLQRNAKLIEAWNEVVEGPKEPTG